MLPIDLSHQTWDPHPCPSVALQKSGAGSDSTPVGESISWQLQSSDGWISPSQPQMGSSGCAVLQSHPRAGASLSPHPKEHHKCIQKCFTISGGFWSSQLCSSTSISASPLLTTVLGHIWSLGPNCEIRSEPSSSHCPPWLQDLPGKYISSGHTRHLPSPASAASLLPYLPRALVSASVF